MKIKFSHNKIIDITLKVFVTCELLLAVLGIARVIVGMLMGDFNDVRFGIYG